DLSVGVYTGTQPSSASTGGSLGATPDAVAFLIGKITYHARSVENGGLNPIQTRAGVLDI
ncbi:hypothetical protein A2U01_0117866, partial [Trifolium medium]|nr:hypothetical protein [Trifolium medium]